MHCGAQRTVRADAQRHAWMCNSARGRSCATAAKARDGDCERGTAVAGAGLLMRPRDGGCGPEMARAAARTGASSLNPSLSDALARLSRADFVPLVDRADVLHHMILYATAADYSSRGDARGVFDCASMPPVLGPVFVWAVGSPGLSLPATVGMPVAANLAAVKGVAYGILQVHYSNPSRTPGVADSSGLLIKTTSARRPIDAGIVELGTTVGSISIPPNRAAFGIQGTCTAARTGSLPAASSLNPLTPSYVVLASALHAHTLGRRLWTEQWRHAARVRAPDGSDPLGAAPFYSFANQRFALAPGGGAALAPGDELVTRCVYTNTRAAGAAGGNAVAAAGTKVVGCEATSCEMCFNFLVMYPRAPGVESLSCAPAAMPFCEDRGADGGGPVATLPSCSMYT